MRRFERLNAGFLIGCPSWGGVCVSGGSACASVTGVVSVNIGTNPAALGTISMGGNLQWRVAELTDLPAAGSESKGLGRQRDPASHFRNDWPEHRGPAQGLTALELRRARPRIAWKRAALAVDEYRITRARKRHDLGNLRLIVRLHFSYVPCIVRDFPVRAHNCDSVIHSSAPHPRHYALIDSHEGRFERSSAGEAPHFLGTPRLKARGRTWERGRIVRPIVRFGLARQVCKVRIVLPGLPPGRSRTSGKGRPRMASAC